MIKEIFEIEPIQKNSLIIFIGIFLLSFLQIFLFKRELLNESSFLILGISLSIALCWSLLNVLPLYCFFLATKESDRKTPNQEIMWEKVIVVLGFLCLCWILLITYISYEFEFSLKKLIRISIILSIIRSFFWFIFEIVARKNRKVIKK
tara:strand:- start:1098 stop:1544 length:447 start_codon:yes stop_codon:yes gene_type:complete